MAKTSKPWFRKGRGWFVTIAGKQRNLGRDKKIAYQEYYRLMNTPTDRRKVSGQSAIAIIDDFLEWVQNNRAPDTYCWYRDLLQKFATQYPDLRVDEVRPFHVQRWVDAHPHLSRNSRRNYMRSVKRCLTWATRQGYIEQNPLQFLEMPAGERREVVISDDQYHAILRFAKPDSLRDLIITTWETGCRPQESLRVEARHVDLQRQRWIIPASEAKGERHVRIVYLTDAALTITKRWMEMYPTGKLFRNSNGSAWTADAVNCAFDRIRERMGKQVMQQRGITVETGDIESLVPMLSCTRCVKGHIVQKSDAELKEEARRKIAKRMAANLAPRYSLYAFRHSWATHALERGIDSVTVAVLMGHSDASMLAKVYQHLGQNPEFLLNQAKKAVATA